MDKLNDAFIVKLLFVQQFYFLTKIQYTLRFCNKEYMEIDICHKQYHGSINIIVYIVNIIEFCENL